MKPALAWMHIGCYTASGFSHPIFTWQDQQGTAYFSDSLPTTEAVEITLAEPNLIPGLEPVSHAPKSSKVSLTPEASQETHRIKLSFLTPHDEENIHSAAGNIMIKAGVNRPLHPEEQLLLHVDGQPYGTPASQTTWRLKHQDRGIHTFSIQAVVNGKVIASTPDIEVYLHRAQVRSPLTP